MAGLRADVRYGGAADPAHAGDDLGRRRGGPTSTSADAGIIEGLMKRRLQATRDLVGHSAQRATRREAIARDLLGRGPAAEGHQDAIARALVHGDRGPVVPEVVEGEVAQAGGARGRPPDARHMDAAIGVARAGVREDIARVRGQAPHLLLEQRHGLVAQDDGTRHRLRLRQQEEALVQVDHVALERAKLRLPHQRERGEPRHGAEGLRHEGEDARLVVGLQDAQARQILGREHVLRDEPAAAHQVEHGPQHAQVANNGVRLAADGLTRLPEREDGARRDLANRTGEQGGRGHAERRHELLLARGRLAARDEIRRIAHQAVLDGGIVELGTGALGGRAAGLLPHALLRLRLGISRAVAIEALAADLPPAELHAVDRRAAGPLDAGDAVFDTDADLLRVAHGRGLLGRSETAGPAYHTSCGLHALSCKCATS